MGKREEYWKKIFVSILVANYKKVCYFFYQIQFPLRQTDRLVRALNYKWKINLQIRLLLARFLAVFFIRWQYVWRNLRTMISCRNLTENMTFSYSSIILSFQSHDNLMARGQNVNSTKSGQNVNSKQRRILVEKPVNNL